MSNFTRTHCTNGHEIAKVGVYRVKLATGIVDRCKQCHRSSIARSRTRKQAERPDSHTLVSAGERDRFWSKVTQADNGCWVWSGANQNLGYGVFAVAGRNRLAHRVAYTEMISDVPEGLSLDHLCRNRLCVNPYHLDPVTHRVNCQRRNAA